LTLIQLYHGSQTALGRSSLFISLLIRVRSFIFPPQVLYDKHLAFVGLPPHEEVIYQQPFPVSEIFERLFQYLTTVSDVVAVLIVAYLQSEADVISL